MKSRSRILFVCSTSALIFSPVSHALSCTEITNQIHRDISTYSDTIQSKRMPWMQLSWLKHQLGTPEKKFFSADEIQYSWKCPDDDNNFLAVSKNKAGVLTKFSGQYSSEDGSGSFSLDKKAIADQSTPANAKPLKQTAFYSKYDLVKQISNDLEEYS